MRLSGDRPPGSARAYLFFSGFRRIFPRSVYRSTENEIARKRAPFLPAGGPAPPQSGPPRSPDLTPWRSHRGPGIEPEASRVILGRSRDLRDPIEKGVCLRFLIALRRVSRNFFLGSIPTPSQNEIARKTRHLLWCF